MKKLIIAAAVLFTGLAAQASIEQEVMSSLITSSKNIKLYDSDNKLLTEQLPERFANALLANYINLEDGKDGQLGGTTVSCKNTTPRGRAGAATFKCTVLIFSGDFKKNDNYDLVGPEAEGGVSFEVEATRAVRPGAKAEVTTKKATVSFAG